MKGNWRKLYIEAMRNFNSDLERYCREERGVELSICKGFDPRRLLHSLDIESKCAVPFDYELLSVGTKTRVIVKTESGSNRQKDYDITLWMERIGNKFIPASYYHNCMDFSIMNSFSKYPIPCKHIYSAFNKAASLKDCYDFSFVPGEKFVSELKDIENSWDALDALGMIYEKLHELPETDIAAVGRLNYALGRTSPKWLYQN